MGAGVEVFDAVSAALLSGALHRTAGIGVPEEGFTPDGRVVLRAAVGPVRLGAPVRVISRERGEGRCVLAYQALPGHPEVGSEEFAVELHDDGSVWFAIAVASRPGPWWARLLAPAARILQHDYTVRYLLAARRYGRS